MATLTLHKRHILVVMGTRPEVVKLAPIVHSLRAASTLEAVVCVTGQHRELLAASLAEFGLVPDIRLDVMRSRQSLSDVSSRLLELLPAVMRQVRPSAVMVQGDTTTAFTAGLAAFHETLPLVHVEAGLRTDDIASPFPEEGNRRMLAALASVHFAPTVTARRNLLREGVPAERVWVTGNTVIDALRLVSRESPPSESASGYERDVLVTAHRRESFGGGLQEIVAAVRELALRNASTRFRWPMHPNPNVREAVRGLGDQDSQHNVQLLEPLSYGEFVASMSRAALVMTDSGGVQEEAPALGVPLLVLGEHTARVEGLRAGVAVATRLERGSIVAAAERLLADPPRPQVDLYGDGRASGRIVEILERTVRHTEMDPCLA